MFNNRKLLNELMQENEKLKSDIESKEADIESKENDVCNLLDANKELSLANTYLEKKIIALKQVIEIKEIKICELNTKLVRKTGQLDKVRNFIKVQIGIDILEGEE